MTLSTEEPSGGEKMNVREALPIPVRNSDLLRNSDSGEEFRFRRDSDPVRNSNPLQNSDLLRNSEFGEIFGFE